MINRILIRIKVVQLLYSYMLTRQDFKVVSAPVNPSRDKRTAYNVYRDVLLMVLDLSGYGVAEREKGLLAEARGNKYLHGNKMAMSLKDDRFFKESLLEGNERVGIYDDVLPDLYREIINSAAYRSYIATKKHDVETDSRFWETILMTTVLNFKPLQAIARDADEANYSLSGFKHGIEMACKTISEFRETDSGYVWARNSLDNSLESAYMLYMGLLRLIVDLTRMQEERLEAGRNKYLPTPEDLNPNTRLVDNRLAKHLAERPELEAYFKSHAFTWTGGDEVMLRTILDRIKASDIYQNYIENQTDDFAVDADFWRQVMRTIILPGDELTEELEERSIYWNDDLHIMGTFVLKTLKQFAANGPDGTTLLPKYKDDEDRAFGQELFVAAIKNKDEYRALIDKFINSATWDSERLAMMDIVIIIAAITELLNYPAIPVAVTLNEYIEIANYYSTGRSGHFINGILYSIINHLVEEGRLVKRDIELKK